MQQCNKCSRNAWGTMALAGGLFVLVAFLVYRYGASTDGLISFSVAITPTFLVVSCASPTGLGIDYLVAGAQT